MASLLRNGVFMYRGLSEFTKGGYEKAAKRFNPKDLEVDLSDKSFIVTGANSGLGRVTAEELARRGGTVHMVCRSQERADAAKKEIVEATKNENVHVHIVDMSRPGDIRKFVADFKSQQLPCHVLVNNAGVLLNERKLTPEGYEMNFATNTLGTYLLTELMLPVLEQSAPSRVITVASGGMYTQKLDNSNLNSEKVAHDGAAIYSMNKRQQAALTHQWAKRVPEDKVKFYLCHPGWAETEGVKSSIPEFYSMLKDKFRTTAEGADVIVWLAASEAAGKGANGKFWQDREVVGEYLPFSFTQHTEKDEEVLVKKLEEIVAKLPQE